MKQGYQCDRPALHIAEPVILNCPSGPFRSEFLMSNKPLFFAVIAAFSSDMEMENRIACGREFLFQRLWGQYPVGLSRVMAGRASA